MTAHNMFDRINHERGQTMAEYSVVLGLIVIVTLATFTQLGDAIEGAINAVRAVTFK